MVGVKSLPWLYATLFRQAGIGRTRSVQHGDMALIRVGRGEAIGALVTSGFVVLDQQGLTRVPRAAARIIAAWRIHD